MNSKNIIAGVVAASAIALNANAGTVAYWPLAYENGVRTTTETVFPNHGDGGAMDAVPSSRQGASWIEGNDYCPQGTNAFPSGYGVYDPISGTNAAAATGLYFHKTTLNGYAGALRVVDPSPLRLTTFTVECFIRMPPPQQYEWNCIAVMPAQLPGGNKQPANYESWGIRVVDRDRIDVRFSIDHGTVSANVSDNKMVSIYPSNIYDERWHHVAFSVDGTKVKVFWDYALVTEADLSANVWYNPGMDLFIGNTPQTGGPFGGSIAHFRISDAALNPPSFLHFVRTERASDEDPDSLLHIDFEPPDSLSATEGIFNDAAVAPAPHRYGADVLLRTVAVATPFSQVYAGLLDETGRASSYCSSNATKQTANGQVRGYIAWQPPEDVFTNSSFTVECCYKTARQLGPYIPLVRRLGGSNVQFNLGLSGGGMDGHLTAAVIQRDGGVKMVIDSVRSDDCQWHHAAFVFDRARGKLQLFRDYEPIGSVDCPNKALIATDTPIYMGGGFDNQGDFRPYNGAIDNVRITMRALNVGEFLRSDNAALSGKTLAWTSFDNTLESSTSAALANGVAMAAQAGGTVPSYEAIPGGSSMRIEDGSGNMLRQGNLAALSFSTGVVKYADNLLLPLLKDQTVEFLVKAGAQAPFAGIVRCNFDRSSADDPVWALSAAESGSGTMLRVRCTISGDDSWNTHGIDEDTGVVAFDGRWHHIALTLSQDGGRATASIYKDYETTPSWTRTVSGSFYYGLGYAPVWIGTSSSTTAFFNGQIDELRVSRGILTSDEFLRRGKMGMMLLFR